MGRGEGGKRKKVRGGKNTLNLLNSTILTTPTFPPHYAPLRHNRNFLNILHTTLRCFVSPPIRGRMEGGGERERERDPFQKKAQLRGEKVREALCRLVNAVQPVWAHPPVCLCASLLCRCVCVCANVLKLCVCICLQVSMCVRCRVHACVYSDWLDKCSTPPQVQCEWSDWLAPVGLC